MSSYLPPSSRLPANTSDVSPPDIANQRRAAKSRRGQSMASTDLVSTPVDAATRAQSSKSATAEIVLREPAARTASSAKHATTRAPAPHTFWSPLSPSTPGLENLASSAADRRHAEIGNWPCLVGGASVPLVAAAAKLLEAIRATDVVEDVGIFVQGGAVRYYLGFANIDGMGAGALHDVDTTVLLRPRKGVEPSVWGEEIEAAVRATFPSVRRIFNFPYDGSDDGDVSRLFTLPGTADANDTALHSDWRILAHDTKHVSCDTPASSFIMDIFTPQCVGVPNGCDAALALDDALRGQFHIKSDAMGDRIKRVWKHLGDGLFFAGFVGRQDGVDVARVRDVEGINPGDSDCAEMLAAYAAYAGDYPSYAGHRVVNQICGQSRPDEADVQGPDALRRLANGLVHLAGRPLTHGSAQRQLEVALRARLVHAAWDVGNPLARTVLTLISEPGGAEKVRFLGTLLAKVHNPSQATTQDGLVWIRERAELTSPIRLHVPGLGFIGMDAMLAPSFLDGVVATHQSDAAWTQPLFGDDSAVSQLIRNMGGAQTKRAMSRLQEIIAHNRAEPAPSSRRLSPECIDRLVAAYEALVSARPPRRALPATTDVEAAHEKAESVSPERQRLRAQLEMTPVPTASGEAAQLARTLAPLLEEGPSPELLDLGWLLWARFAEEQKQDLGDATDALGPVLRDIKSDEARRAATNAAMHLAANTEDVAGALRFIKSNLTRLRPLPQACALELLDGLTPDAVTNNTVSAIFWLLETCDPSPRVAQAVLHDFRVVSLLLKKKDYAWRVLLNLALQATRLEAQTLKAILRRVSGGAGHGDVELFKSCLAHEDALRGPGSVRLRRVWQRSLLAEPDIWSYRLWLSCCYGASVKRADPAGRGLVEVIASSSDKALREDFLSWFDAQERSGVAPLVKSVGSLRARAVPALEIEPVPDVQTVEPVAEGDAVTTPVRTRMEIRLDNVHNEITAGRLPTAVRTLSQLLRTETVNEPVSDVLKKEVRAVMAAMLKRVKEKFDAKELAQLVDLLDAGRRWPLGDRILGVMWSEVWTLHAKRKDEKRGNVILGNFYDTYGGDPNVEQAFLKTLARGGPPLLNFICECAKAERDTNSGVLRVYQGLILASVDAVGEEVDKLRNIALNSATYVAQQVVIRDKYQQAMLDSCLYQTFLMPQEDPALGDRWVSLLKRSALLGNNVVTVLKGSVTGAHKLERRLILLPMMIHFLNASPDAPTWERRMRETMEFMSPTLAVSGPLPGIAALLPEVAQRISVFMPALQTIIPDDAESVPRPASGRDLTQVLPFFGPSFIRGDRSNYAKVDARWMGTELVGRQEGSSALRRVFKSAEALQPGSAEEGLRAMIKRLPALAASQPMDARVGVAQVQLLIDAVLVSPEHRLAVATELFETLAGDTKLRAPDYAKLGEHWLALAEKNGLSPSSELVNATKVLAKAKRDARATREISNFVAAEGLVLGEYMLAQPKLADFCQGLDRVFTHAAALGQLNPRLEKRLVRTLAGQMWQPERRLGLLNYLDDAQKAPPANLTPESRRRAAGIIESALAFSKAFHGDQAKLAAIMQHLYVKTGTAAA